MINLPYVSFKQFFNHFFFKLKKYFYTPCKFEKLPNIYIIDDIPSEIFDLYSLSDGTRCSICLDEEKLVPNCYKCKACSALFHIECYNLFTFSETEEEKISIEKMNDFECYRCREENKKSKIK